jgi:hypothetical protein
MHYSLSCFRLKNRTMNYVKKVNTNVVKVMADIFFSLHILNSGTIYFPLEEACFQKVRSVAAATETLRHALIHMHWSNNIPV